MIARLTARLFAGVVCMACLLLGAPAQADKRVALVIGNSAYRNVPKLVNPTNDAADIAVSLERLGFAVRKVTDASYDDMRRGLLEFGRQVRNADIAVIFFAGHGIEVGGENWLIPVDAELRSDIDVEHEAMGLRSLLPAVESAGKLGLVILDACRNNPFAAKMTRTIRTRSVPRGLAGIEPSGNVLVAYAAKDGTTAADGSGRNSPFTASLLKHVETPGLEVNFLFRNIRDDVIKATRREQQPFIYGSLSSTAIYLKDALPPVALPAPPPGPSPDELTWGFLKDTSDPGALKRFVEQYPKSPYRAEAERRIAFLAGVQKANAQAIEERMAALAAEAAKAKPVGPGPEEMAWGLVQNSKDPGQFRLFLDKFSDSPRRADAERRMTALVAEQRAVAEAADKKIAAMTAEQRAAAQAMEQKIAALAAEAQAAKARPAGPAPEEVAWGLVQNSRDPNQFKLFLDKFPDSGRRRDAEQRMSALAAEQRAATAAVEQRVAALSAEAEKAKSQPAAPQIDPRDVARLLQLELKRVGCFDGAINGEFGSSSRTALGNFAKLASVSLPKENLSNDTLRIIRGIDKRICPLVCKPGEQAEGDRCVRITCPAGQTLKKGACVETVKRAEAPPARKRPAEGAAAPATRSGGGGGGGKCFAFNGKTFCE